VSLRFALFVKQRRFTGGEASTASELDVDEIFLSMGQVDLMGNGMKKTGDVLMGFHGVLMGFNGVSMGFNGGFMGDFSCDSSISICF
jgi:hypothetical protein